MAKVPVMQRQCLRRSSSLRTKSKKKDASDKKSGKKYESQINRKVTIMFVDACIGCIVLIRCTWLKINQITAAIVLTGFDFFHKSCK